MEPINLERIRIRAMQKEEHSGHYQELQVIVFDLCDEVEELREQLASSSRRKRRKAPRNPPER